MEPPHTEANFKKRDEDKDKLLSANEFPENWENPQRGGNVLGIAAALAALLSFSTRIRNQRGLILGHKVCSVEYCLS